MFRGFQIKIVPQLPKATIGYEENNTRYRRLHKKKPRSAFRRGSLRNLPRRRTGQRAIKTKTLYFTYGSRDTLKSFSLFITVKTLTKMNLGHSDKFEIEIVKN